MHEPSINQTGILRAAGLTKIYGAGNTAVRAVDDVSLAIGEGELVLIKGPSGSGKTTLLSILGGLLRPTAGQVFINGVEITALGHSRLPEVRSRQIGFIFQAFNLLPSLIALENVMFPAFLVPGGARRARRRADGLLDRLDLTRRKHAYPKDLSGGEKQRVAIARALINRPRLILADEPTGNLDSRSGHEVAMLLHDIARDDGLGILIATHDPRLEDIADRLLWLEDGRLRDRREEVHDWVRDPVCRMQVDRRAAGFDLEYRGVSYHFCSEGCRTRFLETPETYLEGGAAAELAG